MRPHIPRLAACLVCIIALFWFIPSIYGRAMFSGRFQLSGLYSSTLKQFMILESDANGIRYRDESGKEYTIRAAQQQMPFLYTHNVNKWGGFPLHIDGKTFTYEEAAKAVQFSRLTPRTMMQRPLPLHLLLESSPEGASLELPTDMLRIDRNSLSFINCATGALDVAKSERFTTALQETGAHFPILLASSNPTPLKSFDEGIFLVDARKKLFQLKIVKGSPVCRNTGITVPGVPWFLAIEEHERREFYGAVATMDAAYLILYSGKLQQIPAGDFAPYKNSLDMRFTALHHTFIKNSPGSGSSVLYTATNTNYDLVHKHEEPLPTAVYDRALLVNQGLSLLTPLVLRQHLPTTPHVAFWLEIPSKAFAALGIAVMLLTQAVLCRRQRQYNPWDFLLITVGGLPGFIAVRLFGPIQRLG